MPSRPRLPDPTILGLYLAQRGWDPARLAKMGWTGPLDGFWPAGNPQGLPFLDWACTRSRPLVGCLMDIGVSPNSLVRSWPGCENLRGLDMFGCIEDLVRAGLDLGEESVFSGLPASTAHALLLHLLPGHAAPGTLFAAFDDLLGVMVDHGWDIQGPAGYRLLWFFSGENTPGVGSMMNGTLARGAWLGGDENAECQAAELLEYCQQEDAQNPARPPLLPLLEKAWLDLQTRSGVAHTTRSRL